MRKIPKIKKLLEKRGIKPEYEVVSPKDIMNAYSLINFF